jgi:hypothetical protein
VFRFLLTLLARGGGEEDKLEPLLETYTGPASGDLTRDVAHILSESSRAVLQRQDTEKKQLAIRLAKQAIRWSPTSFEPKLRLIEATSVLWQGAVSQPADQLLMAFCVDLKELSRLRLAFPLIPPVAYEAFLRAWRACLDQRNDELREVIPKMRSEILSQLKFQPAQEDSGESPELDFIWGLLNDPQSAPAPLGAFSEPSNQGQWLDLFREFFRSEPAIRLSAPLFACQMCSEIFKDHRWQCRNCGRWDAISEWTPQASSQANGRPASP